MAKTSTGRQPTTLETPSGTDASAHIAVFIHGLSGGGAQRRTVTLANGFAARGHNVDLVVVSGQGPLARAIENRVHLVQLTPRRAGSLLARLPRRVRLIMAIPALVRYLHTQRPEVVLAAASHVHFPLLWAHRLARVDLPVVLRVSNHLSRNSASAGRNRSRLIAPRLARRLFPRAAAVIAVSQGVAEDVVQTAGYPRDRTTTIYSPTLTPDLPERASAPLEHPWFVAGAPPVVLGVGRLVRQKDFPTLVRAFARVRVARPARLVILGKTKKNRRRRALERLIAELGVSADVELSDYVDNPLRYMSRAAVFVLSSAWEGLPGALIEALACGCPVVSTDCPSGPAEILEHGRFGRLVPVGDHVALADAILETMDDSPDRAALRSRAALFAADVAIDRYLAVLLAVRGGAQGTVAAHAYRSAGFSRPVAAADADTGLSTASSKYSVRARNMKQNSLS